MSTRTILGLALYLSAPFALAGAPAFAPTSPAPDAPATQEESQDNAAEGDAKPHHRQPLPSPDEIALLPRDGGVEFNRLVFERSPYLQQHARNPVDWYPWGQTAFRRALETQRPILLSIGYSTCHWCHVMEHESFEDPEVAALLNELFVCIKVDREERPDVDELFMRVTQAMTGSGGWPNTVFLTPDREPFYAATYLPKRGRHGRMGLMEVAKALSDAWLQDRERVTQTAQSVMAAMAQNIGSSPGGALDLDVVERGRAQLGRSFDERFGGFGPAPKFPMPHTLAFLLRHHHRTGDARSLEMVTATLRAMERGGIHDQLGGGFHRYSTDAEWLLPHFEKMLYDQALLAMAYTEAAQVTGDALFERTARDVLDFVLRELTDEVGAFWSAIDADSEGEEGIFYVWNPDELRAVLGDEDAALAAAWFGVEEGGNFVEQATGEKTGDSVLHRPHEAAAFASERGLELAALNERLASIRARLFAARETRERPFLDDKVLTDWNGLMIAAFAKAARAFGEPRYQAAGVRAQDHLLDRLRDGNGRLFKLERHGQPAGDGMVDDYAFAIWGLIEAHQLTQEPRYLRAALELQDLQLALFLDAEGGGLFVAPDYLEKYTPRAKAGYDGALPAGNSVTAVNLQRLARLSGRIAYEEQSAALSSAFGAEIERAPTGYVMSLVALEAAFGASFELVVAIGDQPIDAQLALGRLGRVFEPNLAVLARPAGDEPLVTKLAPFTAEQRAEGGRTTYYLCRDFACLAPMFDLELVLAKVDEMRRTERIKRQGVQSPPAGSATEVKREGARSDEGEAADEGGVSGGGVSDGGGEGGRRD